MWLILLYSLTTQVLSITLTFFIMVGISIFKTVPLLAGGALASVNYPQIPKDLTTPFQERLAVYGPNGKDFEPIELHINPIDLIMFSRVSWLEHV